jgi:NAD(P)-dependent dehydrogenase (short-subunit alcohol dehydrogenase family)
MDMADFASVSAFATAFEQKYERLDVLVCNAAIAVGVYEASKAGWESTYVFPYFDRSHAGAHAIPASK